ncbi:MAG TPA: alpha-ketoglutarate-dependent dioxygenase AlkB [Dyella sp.]|uniref:alpha-ketoglutarate-dependent dioxygenase AlkB family protein n=1 Tax=Dyella sp. TaxID=1869338 RepID=UPI002F937D17
MPLFHHEASEWQAIDLPGAELRLLPGWMSAVDAERLFRALREEIPWEIHRIRIFGREVDSPRLSCWIGDQEATYVYSRTRFEPRPWTASLASLRARLESLCGTRFNSVLANLYRDGRDSMGWHSDDEPELGARPTIASVSLGATRVFRLRPREGKAAARSLELPSGSVLCMSGDTQRHYRHDLPKMPGLEAPRLI